MFVHGHAAHAHWWDFIAPAFTDRYDVVAIDLSGSGDSDHRPAYSATLFANEIRQVIADAQMTDAVVVGHSFGGTLTRVAAHLHPELISAIVLVDSLIPDRRGTRRPPALPRQRDHVYKSLEDACRRFRLRPPQPKPAAFILDHIARHSIKKMDDGFRFKLDQAVFAKMPADEGLPAATSMIKDMTIPVGFIYGESSRFFPPEQVTALTACITPDLIFPVPNAHHHVFLDEPQVFVSKLEELLSRVTPQA